MNNPDWIWLRGLTREQQHWGQALTSGVQQSHKMMMVDLPGTGLNHKQKSPDSVVAIMERVRLQVLQSGSRLDQPVSLLGLSMGGMVAHAWAMKYPEEVAQLILVNTSLGTTLPFYHRLSPRCYPAMLMALCSTVAKREQIICRLTCNQRHSDLLASWIAIQQQHPVKRTTFFRQLYAAATYRPSLMPPQCPSEIWVADGDKLVSPKCSERLAVHWQVPLLRHASAGHDLPTDAPKWFVAQFTRVANLM